MLGVTWTKHSLASAVSPAETRRAAEVMSTKRRSSPSASSSASRFGPALLETLSSLGDDLRFVLITSAARAEALAGAEDAAFTVRAAVSDAVKCERCWHYRGDVGSDPAHPTICGRCTSNLFGAGEPRRVA